MPARWCLTQQYLSKNSQEMNTNNYVPLYVHLTNNNYRIPAKQFKS